MASALSPRAALRAAYRSERFPALLRWTLAAGGMRDFIRILDRKLKKPLGDGSRDAVLDLCSQLFERRAQVLATEPALAELRDTPSKRALFFSWLYQIPLEPRARWILDSVGGAPRTPRGWFRARSSASSLSAEEKWRELTVHLGDLLIVTTETLPQKLPRARQIVAEMCESMGVRYARRMKKALALPRDQPVANAIEVLRTSEYIFRVNPVHLSDADETTRTGYIDGNACPWYPRPGWGPVHCGIFGQFQAGVCSEFGLRYSLTTTIPKHGGDHCRVDLTPIKIRRSKSAPRAV